MASNTPRRIDLAAFEVQPLPTPHYFDTAFVAATNMGKEEVRLIARSSKRYSEKVEELSEKCIKLFDQINRKHQELCEVNEKLPMLIREKDAVSLERDREREKAKKLEMLCREMQRKNKELTDMLEHIREDEELKRSELSAKFDIATREVISKLDEHTQERLALVRENTTLQSKLKGCIEQYDFRERHIEQLIRAKQLEKMFADTKVMRMDYVKSEDSDVHMIEVKRYRTRLAKYMDRETNLIYQISEYSRKYEELERALEKNTAQIHLMKGKILDLMKRNETLYKENDTLNMTIKNADSIIKSYGEEHNILKNTLEQTRVQRDRLGSLCRSFQQERQQLSETVTQLHLRITELTVNQTQQTQQTQQNQQTQQTQQNQQTQQTQQNQQTQQTQRTQQTQQIQQAQQSPSLN